MTMASELIAGVVIAAAVGVIIWIDARRLGVVESSDDDLIWRADFRPWHWGLFCFLFMALGLPCYLVKRPRYVREFEARQRAGAAAA